MLANNVSSRYIKHKQCMEIQAELNFMESESEQRGTVLSAPLIHAGQVASHLPVSGSHPS